MVEFIELEEAQGAKKALRAQCFSNVGLAIATLAPQIQTGNAAVFTVNGVFYALIATDNYWDLTGFNVTNGAFNICLLCMDDASAMQIGIGTEAALAADVILSDTPADSCVVGQVLVNPTGAGNFVGGTTDLDDAGVVPNAVYTNLSGHPNLYGTISIGPAVADATNVYLSNSMMAARDVEVIASAIHSITL